MKKDAPLAFRIPIELKRKLQRLAKQEARSLSQICEMLLKIGVEGYETTGHSYLQKGLSHLQEDDQE
jgi:predicted DNA-binding protein